MGHDWHDNTFEACLDHAQRFAQSCYGVLSHPELIKLTMQGALASDIKEVLDDLETIRSLFNRDPALIAPEISMAYVRHLEGVVFVQLHKIQELQKEVAKHAAPA